jgi:hypothetical protein
MQSGILQRALGGGKAKGEEGSRLEPLPLSFLPVGGGIDCATEMRGRSERKHAFGGRERAGMARGGSLSTVLSDSFYMEPPDPIINLER